MKEEKYEFQKTQEAIRKSRSGGLALIKKTGVLPENAISGKVSSIVGNHVVVEVYNQVDNIKKTYNCVPAGSIISKNSNLSNLIAAGDIVWFIPEKNSLSSILKIEERRSFFSRQDPANHKKEQILASNIDNVILFFSVVDPILNIKLVDRFLIAATLGGVKPLICINKIDLVEPKSYEYIISIYKKNNIDIFDVSALKKTGVDNIKKIILGKENLVTGPSGSGKSTFLNAILGYEAQTVREISERTNKGTHTTSFSKRYDIDLNTGIIDTPGLREFGIWNLTKSELPLFFHDFLPFIGNCYFDSCSHTHEPKCAVKLAVDKSEICIDRYDSYLNIYETLDK